MKAIEGWPDYYINTRGEVWSHRGLEPRKLKPAKNKQGYLVVVLCDYGFRKQKLVHRLVAEAYLPNPNKLPLVCHRDDNPSNPKLDNLFWGSHKDNCIDSINKGRHYSGPTYDKACLVTTPEGDCLYYDSIAEACREFKLNVSSVYTCIYQREGRIKGYIFKMIK